MDALEAGRQHGPDAEEHRPLGGPVARAAGAVFGAGQDHQRRARGGVAHRGVVDRHHLGAGEEPRHAPLGAGHEQIADADVRERAARHDAVVAAPRTVAVEIGRGHAVLHEVAAGGARLGDAPGRRDVVGRHAVAQRQEHACPLDAARGRGLARHLREERRLLDVGAGGVPVVELAGAGGHGVPARIRLPHAVVAGLELARLHRFRHGAAHLLRGGPDVAEVHRPAVGAGADRIGVEVDVGRARQGVGHDQRGTGKPVGLHQRIDAPLEVAVSRQDGRGDQIPLLHRAGHGLGQRPGVADAGGAAVAHRLESERVEIGRQARLLQVVGDHARSRREARLDPRLHRQAPRHGLARHEPRGHHHAGIARVGAAGDGRDHDRAVADRLARRAGGDAGAALEGLPFEGEAALRGGGGERLAEGAPHGPERHAVLRPLRPRQAGLDRRQIE